MKKEYRQPLIEILIFGQSAILAGSLNIKVINKETDKQEAKQNALDFDFDSDEEDDEFYSNIKL